MDGFDLQPTRAFNHLTGMARKHQLPRYKAENEYMACLEVGVFKPSRSDVLSASIFIYIFTHYIHIYIYIIYIYICAMLGCWMFNCHFCKTGSSEFGFLGEKIWKNKSSKYFE